MFEFIDKIGLEIEGGWDKNRDDLIEDVGVKMGDFKNSVVCGELVSKPMNNIEDLTEFLRKNWPTETQYMCGFHMHFSFKELCYYAALMNKKFQKYFTKCMSNWGESYPIQNEEFWSRLEGNNKFCTTRFNPEKQIFLKKKIHNDTGRYTQLHYAYGLHKTVESRLLPTFVTVECAISGLLAHIECFERFIEKEKPKPFEINQAIGFYDDATVVESISGEILSPARPSRIEKEIPFNIFVKKGYIPPARDYSLKSFIKDEKAYPQIMTKYEFLNGGFLNQFIPPDKENPIF